MRTWERSNDPDFETKKNRILELYEMAERREAVVIRLDEFGPLNLQPEAGRQCLGAASKAAPHPRHLHPATRGQAHDQCAGCRM